MKRSLFQFKVIVLEAGRFRAIHQVSQRTEGNFRYSRKMSPNCSEHRDISVSDFRCVACALLERYPEGYPEGTVLEVDIDVVQKDETGAIVRHFRASSSDDGAIMVSLLEIPSGVSESVHIPLMAAKCFLCVLFENATDPAISLMDLVDPCPGLCRPDCPGLPWLPRADDSRAFP